MSSIYQKYFEKILSPLLQDFRKELKYKHQFEIGNLQLTHMLQ